MVICKTPLDHSRAAIRWAKRPYGKSPTLTNFTALALQVNMQIEANGSLTTMKSDRYWPCLSRLLIMGDPTLAHYIKPSYIEALDCQMATSMMQLWYQDITGKAPKVRSWRIAMQQIGASA